MAFAVERGPREIGPNRRQQLRVRLPRRRPPPRPAPRPAGGGVPAPAARRAPSASAPRPDTPAECRNSAPSPRRSSRSSSRPPHRQREALLRGPRPLAEQRDLHRQLPDVPLRAPPPRARRDEPLSRARGQPWPAPATRRAGRSPRPPHGTAPRAIRHAVAAAPRRASGWRSTAAPAPGSPPRPPPVGRDSSRPPGSLRPRRSLCLYHVLDRTISPTSLDIGF